MKKASIVSIGNELLNGQSVDTNTTYLSSELISIGIPVVSSYTIGDEEEAIVRAFNLAAADADIILVTGGLGPTDDDLTRHAFASYLGTELQLQSELLERLENFFQKRNLHMPERNKIQAYIPTGAKPIENNHGTAPGIMAEVKGKLIFAFPGVPSEMKRMFTESVFPKLQRFSGEQIVVVRKLRCFGAGESTIAELLGDTCRRGRNPLVNCTVEYGIITLHVIATSEDKETARQMAEKEEQLIRNKLGELVYGTAEQDLAEVVGEKLASLAQYHQILCITHLPQIASKGSTHYKVMKRVAGGRTTTIIAELNREERVEELARLLGGKKISSKVLDHARELVESG